MTFQLAYAKVYQFAIVWQSRQSCLDGLGGVVKAGVLGGREGVDLLEHDQSRLDNHRFGPLNIQARILDEVSFLWVTIEHHHRFSKFFAIRECENKDARN